MTTVRAAVIQDGPVAFDTPKTVEKVQALTAAAAASQAQIVVFPEAFISAYPKGLDFGARVGRRTPEGREDFRRYWDSAIAVPGPVTETLGAIARASRVYMVIGVIERDIGTLYCTVLFFSPDGRLMGKHRKLMPTAMERLVWGFGDGSTLPVFPTPLGRLGAVICWENYMPLMRTAMYSKGIQLYCAPTVDDRDTWATSMQHIAIEGRCFVLSSCQYMRRKDFPQNYDTPYGDDPEAVIIRGGSCIADPFGKLLAGPNYDGPCILTAELDLDEIARGKYDLDVVGHYARPDIFRLYINEQATPAVVSAGAAAATHLAPAQPGYANGSAEGHGEADLVEDKAL